MSDLSSTVKPVLRGHSKMDKTTLWKTNGSLMKVESIAECSLGLLLEWLLKTGFTVHTSIFYVCQKQRLWSLRSSQPCLLVDWISTKISCEAWVKGQNFQNKSPNLQYANKTLTILSLNGLTVNCLYINYFQRSY